MAKCGEPSVDRPRTQRGPGLLVLLWSLVVAARAILGVDPFGRVVLAVRQGVVDEELHPGAGVLVGEVLQLAADVRVLVELVLVPQALHAEGDETLVVRA